VLQQQAAIANPSAVLVEGDASHLASVPSQPGSIVPLAAAGDPSRFGGKAASLSVLARTGVAVPWGIALDVDATQAVAAGDESHSQRLREALRGRPGPFAVRSSATVEDSSSASFAGQFRTELGVMSGEEVEQAVVDVWRSGNSAGVHAYQQRLGLSAPVQMAVVVQELVGAQSAGVLFFDPDKHEHIVEASWGYGETVVDGSVSPDRYTIDSSGKLGAVVIGDKKIELVKNGKGLERRDVDTERAKARCLDDRSLSALAELGHRATEAFGDARDIEWALTAGGLVCLQARPITRDL
jgi:pyruvate,water dikinase